MIDIFIYKYKIIKLKKEKKYVSTESLRIQKNEFDDRAWVSL
jgi:hypothetical protein